MKKYLIALGAVALSLSLPGAFAANHVVKELNQGHDGMFVFQPGFLHIKPGDSVTFEPADQGHDSQSLLLPAGAKAWKSEISQPITVKFEKQGVYIYECNPHHTLGMFGVIQVGHATNKAAAEKQAKTLEAGLAMNKDRLSKYLAEVK